MPLLAALVPPALIVALVRSEGVNVPWWDQWDLVPLLASATAGQVSWTELWAHHNEHRPVLPRLLMLALARLTDWDVRYEMFAGIAIALGSLAVLGALIARTVRSGALTAWLVLAASALVFSATQFENWLWGWQVQVFMNVLAACVMVLALAIGGSRPGTLLIAVGAAVAGALSFASGLALLFLLPLGVVLDPRRRGGARLVGAVSTVFAVGAVAVYMAGMSRLAHHPDPWRSLLAPGRFVRYVVAYLGAPLGVLARAYDAQGMLATPGTTTGVPVSALSLAWGTVGVAIVGGAAAWFYARPAIRVSILPWLLLAGYAVLAAMMTALGRTPMGVAHAMSSRYATITALFWISACVMAALAIRESVAAGRRAVTRAMVAVAVPLLVGAAASYGISSVYAEEMIRPRKHKLRYARECLTALSVAPDWCLGVLIDAERVKLLRERAAWLAAARLSVFAAGDREPALSTYAERRPGAASGAIDALGLAAREAPFVDLVVEGWVRDDLAGGRPVVLVAFDGEVLGRTSPGAPAREPGRPEADTPPRWTFRFAAFRLTPGAHRLAAYALLGDRAVVKLGAEHVVNVP